MLTPKDIEKKNFSRVLRGFSPEEVDDFLDRIILDMTDLIAQKEALEAENAELKEEIEDYRESQKSIIHTLDSAKKLMKDISESAEKRADIIIRNAKLDAEMILKEAQESKDRYSGEGTELVERVKYFKARYRQMLEEELKSIDGKGEDLLAELEKEFMPASIMDELPDAEPAPETFDDEWRPDAEPEEVLRSPSDMDYDDLMNIVFPEEAARIPVNNRETVAIDGKAIDELLKR